MKAQKVIDITSVFKSQQLKALQLKRSTARERISRLIKLKEVLIANTNKINEALYNDFKKPKEETFADFDPTISEIDFVNAFLETWMKPQITTTPEALGGEASVSKIIRSTTAGGSVVNHTIMHYLSPFLPFGGVGNSGIGKGNGYFGFFDFSNQRPVLEM